MIGFGDYLETLATGRADEIRVDKILPVIGEQTLQRLAFLDVDLHQRSVFHLISGKPQCLREVSRHTDADLGTKALALLASH